MNISRRFIEYPIMTTLLSIALVIFGVFGYLSLPVSQLPNVDFPTINVSASLAGADPNTMATAVAVPLENAFTQVAGISEMTSTSQQGQTNITIQFNLDRSIDGAALDVQTAIASALPLLPKTMVNPPTFQKVNPADTPILVVNLASKTLPMTTVDYYTETLLARQLSTLDGVSQITVFGAAQYAVRVQADPNALAARGIGLDQLTAAVQAMNVNQATGSLNGKNQAEMIDTTGQLSNADQFRKQIIAYSNGAPVHLGDVANVIDSVTNVRQGSWYKGQPSLSMFIMRQPGANTIQVVDEIKGVLASFEKTLPPGIDVSIENDLSRTIRASVDNVQDTLLIAAILVVGVIFVFLRKVTATIIPALALPISVIGTFAGMRALGFSLDNLSLMALTLSVGFVVDDAIVMLENIVRHIERGEKPYEAAMTGSAEIGFTILSMTLSLAAVFIPIAFMSGIVGRLLNEFAVTIIIAILFSGLVSITLTPMLCARFLRAEHDEKHNAFYRLSENIFNRVQESYDRTLRWALAHKPVIMGLFVLSLASSVLLFWIIPMDFLPSDDTGQLQATIQSANGTSYQNMAAYGMKVSKIVNADPNVLGAMLRVTSSGAGANQAMVSIHLKDSSDRSLNADEVARELRRKLGNMEGMNVYVVNPPTIRIGARVSSSSYQYTLQGQDLDQLEDVSGRLMKELQQSPVIVGVTSDFLKSAPAEHVAIDRDRAAALGVTAAQIEAAMGEAFGGEQVGTLYNDTMQYQVIMELLPQYQSSAASLSSLYIKSTSGQLVPLSAVTTVSHSTMPLTVNHSGEVPAITISFDLANGYALSDAVTAVQQASAAIDMPATVTGNFQGTASAFQASTQNMGILLFIATIVVYIILGILYESFIHPLTILSGLPSAAVGALLTLYIVGLPLTIYAFVGMIMLIGIVKKNAIMMIDFALQRERGGDNVSAEQAIYEAAIIRFRPIMMTTMAAMMGTLPIAFGTGLGADGRRPLGLCVAGGLLLSQLLTLYITPVIYVYLDHLGTHGLRWRSFHQVSDVPAE